MSQLSEHFARETERYGRRTATLISVVLHLTVLMLGAWFASRETSERPEPMIAHRVKLGGPKNMKLGGAKRKAPVAGVRRAKKKAPEKARPSNKKNVVGLKKRTVNKRKKPPNKPSANQKKVVTGGSRAEVSPTKKTKTKGPRAIGGLGGNKGVALQLGDGATDVNLDDLTFNTFFKMVSARLAERWGNQGLRGGETKVRFHIHRDGTVSDVTVAKSSGLSYLDGPAKRAVMGADFPPLPQSYEGEQLILNIIFDYDE